MQFCLLADREIERACRAATCTITHREVKAIATGQITKEDFKISAAIAAASA